MTINRFIYASLWGILAMAFAQAHAGEKLPVFQVIGQEPYSFATPEGETAGYHYEIANLILAEAGYEARAIPMPLKRLIRNMKSGASDCILAANSPFAQKHFTTITEIGHDLVVGVLPRKGVPLHQYEDLYAIRVGVPAGMSIGQPFDSDTAIHKIDTPDYPRSALMLKAGRIDAIMGAIESIRFGAAKAFPKGNIAFGKPLETQRLPVALICNNDVAKTAMADRLKAATERLKARGDIQKVIGRLFLN